MWQEIYAHYNGNPLALKLMTIEAIVMTGGGEAVLQLYPLIRDGKVPFRSIDDPLQRQFDRLSPIEQQLVYWLAIAREPITSIELRSQLLPHKAMQGDLFTALQSILRRSIATRQDSVLDASTRDYFVCNTEIDRDSCGRTNPAARSRLRKSPAAVQAPKYLCHS